MSSLKCIVFDNAYPEALPTIPVRTQLFTGQRTLPYRPWQPLTKEDISIAEILRAEGYVCGLVSDTYHYRAPGMNFHRGFHAYRWIRGQEYDPWTSHLTSRSVDDYVKGHYDAFWRGRMAQFLANTDDFTQEGDWFPAQVVDEAVDWLQRNRAKSHTFALIDCFDPHEPWDPPTRFDTYKVSFMIRLPGGRGARRTPAIVQFHDVLPTLLDVLGMSNNTSSMHGHSFLPVLHGDADVHREVIITGYHEAVDRAGMSWHRAALNSCQARRWPFILSLGKDPMKREPGAFRLPVRACSSR